MESRFSNYIFQTNNSERKVIPEKHGFGSYLFSSRIRFRFVTSKVIIGKKIISEKCGFESCLYYQKLIVAPTFVVQFGNFKMSC